MTLNHANNFSFLIFSALGFWGDVIRRFENGGAFALRRLGEVLGLGCTLFSFFLSFFFPSPLLSLIAS